MNVNSCKSKHFLNSPHSPVLELKVKSDENENEEDDQQQQNPDAEVNTEPNQNEEVDEPTGEDDEGGGSTLLCEERKYIPGLYKKRVLEMSSVVVRMLEDGELIRTCVT